jgi:hypothetical protein
MQRLEVVTSFPESKTKAGPQGSIAAYYQNLLEKVPAFPRPQKKAGPQTVTKSPINSAS